MDEKALKSLLALCEKGNNLGEKITLVGATKTVDIDTINLAVSLGLTTVAENRVQEFREKFNFINGATHHFIGHLQSNKVKYLVGNVSLIHSVDSFSLAETISTRAQKLGVCQEILVEVNVGGELSKSGFSLENAESEIERISTLLNVKITGLMAMLPKTDDLAKKISLCKRMRELFDKLKEKYPNFTHLSMGMSEDYEIAVQNGSNMIRIGSLIFGKRNYGGN